MGHADVYSNDEPVIASVCTMHLFLVYKTTTRSFNSNNKGRIRHL